MLHILDCHGALGICEPRRNIYDSLSKITYLNILENVFLLLDDVISCLSCYIERTNFSPAL